MRRKPLLALAVVVTAAGAGTAYGHSSPNAAASGSTGGTAGAAVVTLPQCSNGKDDDGDGLVDMKDPGCVGTADDNEYNLPAPPSHAPLGVGGEGVLPREFFGLAQGGDLDRYDLDQIESTKVRTMRVALSWPAYEPRQGQHLWPDRLVGLLAAHHIRPVLMVSGAPEWATGSSYSNTPPRNRRGTKAWKRFLMAAAARYGSHGSFWKAHPELPKKPVKSWQIWNEPNLAKFFGRRRRHSILLVRHAPRAYAHLVKSADRAIRRVDKHAKVILAGLTSNPEQDNMLPWRFLQRFLRVPGIERHFSGVALHPYAANMTRFKNLLRRTRRAIRRGGAKKKGLWLTEVGWGSARDRFPLTKGPEGQAKLLRRSFSFIVRRRKRLNVSRVFWFYWRDPKPPAGRLPCTFCTTAGLLRHQRKAKPSYGEFRSFTLLQR